MRELQDMVVLPKAKVGGIYMQEGKDWVVRVYVSLPGTYLEFIEPVDGFPSNHLKNQVLLLAG
jgi:hypothetical protein